MADVYSLTIKADTTDVARAKTALEGLAAGATKAQGPLNKLPGPMSKLPPLARKSVPQFKAMRGATQQLGFQIQDLAVQLSSGTSAFVAFGQQGPQIASIFGPGGAVFGAIFAIGAAIGGTLFNALGKGSEGVDDLTERTKELVTELGKATDLQREFINTQFQQSIAEQRTAIIEAEESIRSVNARLEDFRRAVGENVPDAVFNSNSAVQSLRQELTDAGLSIDNANATIEAITKQQKEFWEEVEETGNQLDDTTDKLTDFVEGIVAQGESVGMTARETAIYEANRLGATQADRDAINAAFDQIKAEKEKQQALKDTIAAQKEQQQIMAQLDPAQAEFTRYADQIDAIETFNISAREKEALREEAFRQHQEKMAAIAQDGGERTALAQQQGLQMLTESQATAVGAIGDIFGNLASIAEKGGKDAFETYKRFAQAQALVNTALAVSNALAVAPPPVGIALATTIGALGAVQVAAIENQQYQGARQMGGSVSAGGRYLVGENGPEVVTMGGSGVVTPSSVTNQGGSTSVTQVFQMSDNVSREVKQQLLQAAPFIRAQAKQAVLESAGQGGAMSRAVGRRR